MLHKEDCGYDSQPPHRVKAGGIRHRIKALDKRHGIQGIQERREETNEKSTNTAE